MPATNLNPPKQSRSRRTLERIVQASLEILETEGPAGLTVHAVVDRAGSSVGSFYARFGGKDDLLDYLEERIWDEASDRWTEVLEGRDWADVPLSELVEASVGLLLDTQESRSRHLLALDHLGSRDGHAYANFRRQVLDGLTELLLGRAAEIVHDEPPRAVRIALQAVAGVVDAQGEGGEGAALPREKLAAECRALAVGYLTGVAGAGSDAGVDFFEVWS